MLKLLLPILLLWGLRWMWRKRGWKERFSRLVDVIILVVGAVYLSALVLWSLGWEREEVAVLSVVVGLGMLLGLEVLLRGFAYWQDRRK